jgi:hypothetical protein
MNRQKLEFLKSELVPILQKLEAEAKGRWGVMNGQEMVEHLTDSVKNASGKLVLPLVNKGDSLEKSRLFLMSEKPFKENTKNPLIGERPFPLRKADMQSAIQKLGDELDTFFLAFEDKPELTTLNPIFGELDYTMNVQLLEKHARHHLRQFGLID